MIRRAVICKHLHPGMMRNKQDSHYSPSMLVNFLDFRLNIIQIKYRIVADLFDTFELSFIFSGTHSDGSLLSK